MGEFSQSCRADSFFSYRQSDRGAYIVWNVRDFSTLKGECTEYKSPEFKFKNVLWNLSLFPCGHGNRNLGNVSLFLSPCSPFPSKLNFTLCCQNKSGPDLHRKVASKDFSDGKDYGYPKFLKRQDLLDGKYGNLIPDDILTIYCEIKMENSETEEETSTDVENNSILSEFREAFDSGKFSDVVLRVGGQTIPAHKLILSTHSEVFRGMFESDRKEVKKVKRIRKSIKLEESQDNIVDLIDMDFTVAKAMLIYMYTRELEELSPEKTLELYIAAEKYMLTELKEKCREYVLSNMTSTIVCDVFEIANLHSDTILSEATKKFFARNAKSILKTKEWKEFSVQKQSSSVQLLSFAIASNDFF